MVEGKVPNRPLFFAIIGLAVILILCAMVTNAVGWTRLCGGALIGVGVVILPLAEKKLWPLLFVLVGLALFFAEALPMLLTRQ